MRNLIIIALGIFLFLSGYYLRKYIENKDKDDYHRVLIVNENGVNLNMFTHAEFNVFLNNKFVKYALSKGKVYFEDVIKGQVYLDLGLDSYGEIQLMKIDSPYYEILYRPVKREPYSFRNIYLATPDTIYKVIFIAYHFRIDTVKPIKEIKKR